MEQAEDSCGVDRADSPSVSPGADEHAKSVQTDQEVHETQETSDESQLRAFCLAIDIAILESIEPVLPEVTVHLDIIPLVIIGDADASVGSFPCCSFFVLISSWQVDLANVGPLQASTSIKPDCHVVHLDPIFIVAALFAFPSLLSVAF